MTRMLLTAAFVLLLAACTAPAATPSITSIDPTAIDTLWLVIPMPPAKDAARLTADPGDQPATGCPVPWGSPVQIRQKWGEFARVRSLDCEGWILMSKLEVR